jgi:hypothetical protein
MHQMLFCIPRRPWYSTAETWNRCFHRARYMENSTAQPQAIRICISFYDHSTKNVIKRKLHTTIYVFRVRGNAANFAGRKLHEPSMQVVLIM